MGVKTTQLDENKLLDQISKVNFFKLVTRPITILAHDILIYSCLDPERFKKIRGYNHAYLNTMNIDSAIYYNRDEVQKESEIVLSKIKSDKEYSERTIDFAEKFGNEILDWTTSVKQLQLDTMSYTQLLELFKTFLDKMSGFCTHLVFPLTVEQYLQQEISKELAKHLHDPTKVQEWTIKLTTPFRKSLEQQEKSDLLNLAIRLQNSEGIENQILQHIENYGHFGHKHGIGQIWTKEEILQRLKSIENPKRQLEEISDHTEQINQEYEEFVSKYALDKDFINTLTVAKKYVWFRTFRMNVFDIGYTNVFPLISEIGKRKGLTPNQIQYVLIQEILSNKLPPNNEINRRIASHSYVNLNGNVKVYTGKLGAKIKQFMDKEISEIEKLQGVVASNPIKSIKGKVKIISTVADLHKVKQGDILVAPMTTPNFIPAMERAAAFVTDEGGILCHAAIVSREMKKPCIIGTKHATKFLTDNDLVELDLEAGIIKKLSKFNNLKR